VGNLAVSGPAHAEYLSGHPEERSAYLAAIGSLEKEIACAEVDACDRETLLSELASCKKNYLGHAETKGDDIFEALKLTWRDVIVAAIAAYATWKGRDLLEGKVEEFARMQARYVLEEMRKD